VRSPPPLDESEYRRWREEADQALAGARAQGEAGIHNWACFGAEQSAQLALKAILHGVGRAPWGHDLLRLDQMASEAGLETPPEVADALERLARHYIPARYPDAHAGGNRATRYGPRASAEAIGDSERVLAFVDEQWSTLRG
jgi:HEPN domain-containing protein